jgi:hypothetical protein
MPRHRTDIAFARRWVPAALAALLLAVPLAANAQFAEYIEENYTIASRPERLSGQAALASERVEASCSEARCVVTAAYTFSNPADTATHLRLAVPAPPARKARPELRMAGLLLPPAERTEERIEFFDFGGYEQSRIVGRTMLEWDMALQPGALAEVVLRSEVELRAGPQGGARCAGYDAGSAASAGWIGPPPQGTIIIRTEPGQGMAVFSPSSSAVAAGSVPGSALEARLSQGLFSFCVSGAAAVAAPSSPPAESTPQSPVPFTSSSEK